MHSQPNPVAQLDAAIGALHDRWQELNDALAVRLDPERYGAEGVPLCSRECIVEMCDRMFAAHELATDALVVSLGAL